MSSIEHRFLFAQTIAKSLWWLGHPRSAEQAYKLWTGEAQNKKYAGENYVNFVKFQFSLTKLICGKFDQMQYIRLEYGRWKQCRVGYIAPRMLIATIQPGIRVLL